MKKRIFYIIHLDKERILFLSVILTTLIVSSFTAGYKIGLDKKNELQNLIVDTSNVIEKNLLESMIPETKTEVEIPSPTIQEKNISSLQEQKKLEKTHKDIKKENKPVEKIPNREEPTKQIETPNIQNDKLVYREPFKIKEWNTNIETKKQETPKENHQYYIQIASFKTLEDLQKLKSNLEKNGLLCNYKKHRKYYVLYTYAKSNEEVENTKEMLEDFNIKKVFVKKLKNNYY